MIDTGVKFLVELLGFGETQNCFGVLVIVNVIGLVILYDLGKAFFGFLIILETAVGVAHTLKAVSNALAGSGRIMLAIETDDSLILVNSRLILVTKEGIDRRTVHHLGIFFVFSLGSLQCEAS